jgi:hypothetical protein
VIPTRAWLPSSLPDASAGPDPGLGFFLTARFAFVLEGGWIPCAGAVSRPLKQVFRLALLETGTGEKPGTTSGQRIWTSPEAVFESHPGDNDGVAAMGRLRADDARLDLKRGRCVGSGAVCCHWCAALRFCVGSLHGPLVRAGAQHHTRLAAGRPHFRASSPCQCCRSVPC